MTSNPGLALGLFFRATMFAGRRKICPVMSECPAHFRPRTEEANETSESAGIPAGRIMLTPAAKSGGKRDQVGQSG
jgi:hypothetical protein